MDAAAAGQIQAAAIQQQINYAVAAKTMDSVKAQGQTALKLLESAMQVSGTSPSTERIDGKGGQLDLSV